MRVRRRSFKYAPQSNFLPHSSTSDRMYVPFEHTTRKYTDGSSIFISVNSETVISRGCRSSVRPLRAYLYSGFPPYFTAEYIGGTCSCAPTNVAKTSRICFSSMSEKFFCSCSGVLRIEACGRCAKLHNSFIFFLLSGKRIDLFCFLSGAEN